MKKVSLFAVTLLSMLVVAFSAPVAFARESSHRDDRSTRREERRESDRRQDRESRRSEERRSEENGGNEENESQSVQDTESANGMEF
ncbi:MAG TPA: hypothetical protein VF817_02645 [Patescibacteria group bacterium]